MKKSWLIGTTAFMLLSSSAWAEDKKPAMPDAPPPHGMKQGDHPTDGGPMMGTHKSRHGNMTLEEARAKAKERLEKLEKMTPEEWEAKKKERKERREKWKAMSPEQKEKFKQEMREKRMQGGAAGDSPVPKQAAQ